MKALVTSCVLASAVLLPLSGNAQEVKGPKLDWNITVWGNPRAFAAGMELISKEIIAKTGGNFTIKTVYGSVLSPERENLDNIKIGSIDGAFICAGYHPGKNPGMTVLDLPFLPTPNFEVQETVAEAVYHHPFIVAEMKKWNAYPFMAALLPQYGHTQAGLHQTQHVVTCRASYRLSGRPGTPASAWSISSRLPEDLPTVMKSCAARSLQLTRRLPASG